MPQLLCPSVVAEWAIFSLQSKNAQLLAVRAEAALLPVRGVLASYLERYSSALNCLGSRSSWDYVLGNSNLYFKWSKRRWGWGSCSPRLERSFSCNTNNVNRFSKTRNGTGRIPAAHKRPMVFKVLNTAQVIYQPISSSLAWSSYGHAYPRWGPVPQAWLFWLDRSSPGYLHWQTCRTVWSVSTGRRSN